MSPPPLGRLFAPDGGILEYMEAWDRYLEAERIRKLAAFAQPVWDALPDFVQSSIAKALTPIGLAPAGATEAEQFEHYERIMLARGFAVDPLTPTVLAIRGMSSDGNIHLTSSSTSYDDTLVVLTRDANGEPHVRVFAGSTHAGQATAQVGGSVGVPDVAGEDGGAPDGRADVGMIQPGEYRLDYRAGGHNGDAAWNVTTTSDSGDLPGVRDTNHDRDFSSAERAGSEARGDTLDGVMIHRGGPDSPQSAGCINLSRNEDVYPEFISTVGGDNTSMKLVLLDASEP